MSGLALFKFKYPSLLQFETHREADPNLKRNLANLFQIQTVPCDTYMRERLDLVDPKAIRPAFKSVFAAAQRGKVLEKYSFINGKYLSLVDGTGHSSSKKVHCENCCEKHHKDGTVTYYH